jgi:hypothetical protein
MTETDLSPPQAAPFERERLGAFLGFSRPLLLTPMLMQMVRK